MAVKSRTEDTAPALTTDYEGNLVSPVYRQVVVGEIVVTDDGEFDPRVALLDAARGDLHHRCLDSAPDRYDYSTQLYSVWDGRMKHILTVESTTRP